MRTHPLRAAAERRQDQLLARAERSADVADAAVHRVWRAILDVIDRGGHYGEVLFRVRVAVHGLSAVARDLGSDLIESAGEAVEATRRDVGAHLPRADAERLARRRLGLREDVSDDVLDLILPAHPSTLIHRIVYGSGWREQIAGLTSLAEPDVIASLVAHGVQRGQKPYEIAKSILPAVENYKVSARRVARTAGMFVAHEAELSTYEQLGDMVKAYQIHSSLAPTTRPEHRARNNTIYHRVPAAGEKGFDDMPRPPRESARDGNRWAFNCLCWLSPVLDV